MTARQETQTEPTLESVEAKLSTLESSRPSIEVFTTLMQLNHELVDAFMALPEDADKEPANALDVRIKAFSNQLLAALQQKEERHASQVLALHTRAPKEAQQHGRTHSLRQRKHARPGDLQAAA